MLEAWAEKYLNSKNDSCWFCRKNGCDEFDTEFDTFLHRQCLKDALRKDPGNHEARIMLYLLEELQDPEYKEIKALVDSAEEAWFEYEEVENEECNESSCSCHDELFVDDD